MLNEEQTYFAKLACDDCVWMLFDLDYGNKLEYDSENIVHIDDLWKFKYKRQLVSETIDEYGNKTMVNNFFIKVWYNDIMILDFDMYGAQRKITLRTLESFHINMFLKLLEEYRKVKFNV